MIEGRPKPCYKTHITRERLVNFNDQKLSELFINPKSSLLSNRRRIVGWYPICYNQLLSLNKVDVLRDQADSRKTDKLFGFAWSAVSFLSCRHPYRRFLCIGRTPYLWVCKCCVYYWRTVSNMSINIFLLLLLLNWNYLFKKKEADGLIIVIQK